MRMCFLVTAYILYVLSDQRGVADLYKKYAPDGQHHLCEEGADNECEDGVERAFVASVSRKDENGNGIRICRYNSYTWDIVALLLTKVRCGLGVVITHVR